MSAVFMEQTSPAWEQILMRQRDSWGIIIYFDIKSGVWEELHD